MNRAICKAGTCTLGVYLLHEHIAIRAEWPKLFFALFGKPQTPVTVLLLTFFAALMVFIVGVLVEVLRKLLFKGCSMVLNHFSIYRTLNLWLDKLIIKGNES